MTIFNSIDKIFLAIVLFACISRASDRTGELPVDSAGDNGDHDLVDQQIVDVTRVVGSAVQSVDVDETPPASSAVVGSPPKTIPPPAVTSAGASSSFEKIMTTTSDVEDDAASSEMIITVRQMSGEIVAKLPLVPADPDLPRGEEDGTVRVGDLMNKLGLVHPWERVRRMVHSWE